MKSVTIARNYAEALFAAGDTYGPLLDAVAGAIQADERIAAALESPRVSKTAKSQILERALTGQAPREFVRFLQAVVRRGRQGLLSEIAQEYQVLLDQKLNRVHAGVTLANEADARTRQQVVERLTKALGREVRAYFRSDPRILGGVVVRVGDRIFDGSVRRRLTALQRRMLTGE
ncbi:MAG: ATP synthase F1 subunit delta [Gemmatimonadetes bacterium 13_1_40CM_66_11]|nr:MAG: ATP synthase F1 subunit delta [Gemmatimonadetes bacterium 13_1_40CM_66_11]